MKFNLSLRRHSKYWLLLLALALPLLPVRSDAAVLSRSFHIDNNVGHPAYWETLPGFDAALGTLSSILIRISGEYRFTADYSYSGSNEVSGLVYSELLPGAVYAVADIYGELEGDPAEDIARVTCSRACFGTATGFGRFSTDLFLEGVDLPSKESLGDETFVGVEWSDEIMGEEFVWTNYQFSSFLSVHVDYDYVEVAAVPLPGGLPLLLSVLGGAGLLHRGRRGRASL